jgi:histidine kinase
LLRTFNEVTAGARRLAEGHYDTRVDEPREAELADLAQSVNTLADSLQRTAETRARLVSDLAHEIRNPLSTIEGYMEGLIDGVLPPSRETYQAVSAEAHRLQRLTRDLSTLSKAQEGAIEYDMMDGDLAAIGRRVAETLAPQFEANEVTLSVRLGEPLPVHGDPDRLAQAVTNLLGNALAHTPPGGTVSVTGINDSASCSIAIADTGPGIPQTELETIFERFTRLDREQPGTGIGLNIARTLVRDHRGEVTAVSPGAGQGATFTVTLPRR